MSVTMSVVAREFLPSAILTVEARVDLLTQRIKIPLDSGVDGGPVALGQRHFDGSESSGCGFCGERLRAGRGLVYIVAGGPTV
jgi:hypothetical protein